MGQACNTFLTKWHETFVTGMGYKSLNGVSGPISQNTVEDSSLNRVLSSPTGVLLADRFFL